MHDCSNARSMSLQALADACAEDNRHSPASAPDLAKCCLELFRRAIVERDEQAWDLIYYRYQRMVLSWISRNPVFHSTGEDASYFVQEAFTRMWQHMTPQKFTQLNDIKPVLSYLKMCVNSTLVDHMRRERQPTEELTETIVAPHEPAELESADKERLWSLVAVHIHGDKEWLVVRGLMKWGFKPNELYNKYHTLFRDVQEIYSIWENILNRLRRDDNLKRFLGI